MLQGDSYSLIFNITFNSSPLTPELVDEVEVVVGELRKTYTGGGVTFNNNKWLFHFTQQESFGWNPLTMPVQARVLFKTGNVMGGKSTGIPISYSLSKEIL